MDMDFSQKLKGFENVWQRVQQQAPSCGKGSKAAPQPTRPKVRSRAGRFDPRHG